MKITEAVERLGLEVITMPDPDAEIDGCYVGDLLSWVMGRASAGNLWITIMTNLNIIAVASLAGVSAVIIAENAELAPEVKQTAETQGINLLRSRLPAYETAVEVSKL